MKNEKINLSLNNSTNENQIEGEEEIEKNEEESQNKYDDVSKINKESHLYTNSFPNFYNEQNQFDYYSFQGNTNRIIIETISNNQNEDEILLENNTKNLDENNLNEKIMNKNYEKEIYNDREQDSNTLNEYMDIKQENNEEANIDNIVNDIENKSFKKEDNESLEKKRKEQNKTEDLKTNILKEFNNQIYKSKNINNTNVKKFQTEIKNELKDSLNESFNNNIFNKEKNKKINDSDSIKNDCLNFDVNNEYMTVSSEKISKENCNISNLQSFNYSSINNNMEEEENYNNYDDNIGKKALTKLKYEYYKNKSRDFQMNNFNNFENINKINNQDEEKYLIKNRYQSDIIKEIMSKYKYPITYNFKKESEKNDSNENNNIIETFNTSLLNLKSNDDNNKNLYNIYKENNNKNKNKYQKKNISQSHKNIINIKNNINKKINNNNYNVLKNESNNINNSSNSSYLIYPNLLPFENNENNNELFLDDDNLADKIKPISLEDINLIESNIEKIKKLYFYGQENYQYLKRLQLKYNILKDEFNQLIKIKKEDMNKYIKNDNILKENNQEPNYEFKEFLLKENNSLKNENKNYEDILIMLIDYINEINMLFNNKKIDILKIKQIIKDYESSNKNNDLKYNKKNPIYNI